MRATVQTGGCVFILFVWLSLHIWLTVITFQFFFPDASLIPSSLKYISLTSVLLFSICICVSTCCVIIEFAPEQNVLSHKTSVHYSFQPYQVNMDKQQMQFSSMSK